MRRWHVYRFVTSDGMASSRSLPNLESANFGEVSTMLSKTIQICLLSMAVASSIVAISAPAEANYHLRQYYGSWSYHPTTNYYYCSYHYLPTVSTLTYSRHYVIYFPSRPTYRYFYNPIRRAYWGRYEVDSNGKPIGYSMLEPADRRSSLEDIPESAFPKPTKMPTIPDSSDQVRMEEPPIEIPTKSR